MTTINSREYADSFSGLTSTAITSVTVLTVSVVGREILMRLRRYKGPFDKPDRGMEGWAMGYLYRARTWAIPPTLPDHKPYPLSFITQAIGRSPSFYADHVGGDAATYVAILRGLFYWLFALSCTVFPVLFSINVVYAPDNVPMSSITRASIQSLAVSEIGGDKLLYVHVICIWLITFSWFGILLWAGYSMLKNRRRVIRRYQHDEDERFAQQPSTPSTTSDAPPISTSSLDVACADTARGWRFRTLLVRNIPPHLRSESALAQYFEYYLIEQRLINFDPNDLTSGDGTPAAGVSAAIGGYVAAGGKVMKAQLRKTGMVGALSGKPFVPRAPGPEGAPVCSALISSIVLLRRENELNELCKKRWDVQHQLEAAHTQLAQNVLEFAKHRTAQIERGEPPTTTFRPWYSPVKMTRPLTEVELLAREGDDELVERLRPYLSGERAEQTKVEHGTVEPDAASIEANAKATDPDALKQSSVWTVLHDLPPLMLDRFQPLHKLKHFRGQKVPTVDFLAKKLNLLSALIDDKRAHIDAYEPASTAFVTFRKLEHAKQARRFIRTRPGGKPFECKLSVAPEKRDIDYDKILETSLTSDLVRGIIVQVFMWATTIFWVFPLGFVVSILTLEQLSSVVPDVANFLAEHDVVNSIFSNLLPTAIIALIGMLVPTLFTMITRKGQSFITLSKLHATVQQRYYKWAIVNIVIIFCAGVTIFSTFLAAFQSPDNLLQTISEQFSKGATFFVSWMILVIGMHNGVELVLFGIPFINHASIRKLKAPRKREEEAQPRSLSVWYHVSNHLLVYSVTIIFALLNPLIIPFAWVYFTLSFVVFKNQFAHVYWRRWYENNGRMIYRRFMRYSLDLNIVAQVVAFVFLQVFGAHKLGIAVIPLVPVTFAVKIISTRWFDALMGELDEFEAEAVCGSPPDPARGTMLPPPEAEVAHIKNAAHNIAAFTLVTLPALTLRPDERLPATRGASAIALCRRAFKGTPTDSPPQERAEVHTSLESGRPILAESVNGDATPPHSAATEKDPSRRASIADDAKRPSTPSRRPSIMLTSPDEKTRLHGEDQPLIMRHAAVIRDDRPRFDLRYDNPARVQPLEYALWLPRNPLIPLDLGDTIDYYGHALVSSEGGNGILGTFVSEKGSEDEKQDLKHELAELHEEMARVSEDEDNEKAEVLTTGGDTTSQYSRAFGRRRLRGSERIRVASEVAARIEAEEGSLRPAASRLSRLSSRLSHQSSRHDGAESHLENGSRLSPRPQPHTWSPSRQSAGADEFPFPDASAQGSPPPLATGARPARSSSVTSKSGMGRARSRSDVSQAKRRQSAGSMPSPLDMPRPARHHVYDETVVEEDEPPEDEGPIISQSEAVHSEILEELKADSKVWRLRERLRRKEERQDVGIDPQGGKQHSSTGSWRRFIRRIAAREEAVEDAATEPKGTATDVHAAPAAETAQASYPPRSF